MKAQDKIGFWPATSLVVGNMIGSGVFLLPVTLAIYGLNSVFGWLFSAFGAILLSIIFGYLSKHLKNSEGGPYAFTVFGLGRFPGYLVAWGYWISIWSTNAAIAVALVSYLSVIFPIVGASAFNSIITGLAFVWFFTWINTKQIKTIGIVQLLTTVLKVAPLVFLAIVGIFYVDLSNLEIWAAEASVSFESITAATTLTFFAFLGMESATIPSKGIANAEQIIKKATIYGTIFTAALYISSFLVVSSIIPPGALKNSSAPFADTANELWGGAGKMIFAWGAVIASLGALNGWILIQGRIPYSAAKDNLFPKIFAKVNRNDSPVIGIIISSILASALMMLNYSKSLVDAFSFMMKLSTLSVLTPYLFSIATFWIMVNKEKKSLKNKANVLVALLAFIFSIWVIIGCGQEVVFYGFILLMIGIPFYIYINNIGDD